jgi:pimeloyl-ACP methyl ester carboxylesterase
LVEEAIGGRNDVVLVAQSLGGFTALMVAARTGVGEIVFVNAMIPNPDETPGACSAARGTGSSRSGSNAE